jgi:hypothetical protein
MVQMVLFVGVGNMMERRGSKMKKGLSKRSQRAAATASVRAATRMEMMGATIRATTG